MSTSAVPPRGDADAWRRRVVSLHRLIGCTPLLALRCRMNGEERTVYAKHETLNFTGSIKDRMALRILEEAHAAGVVQPGDEVVEATSGNTGISLAAVGRALGHSVRIYMPDWMSRERTLVIESLGAEVIPVSVDEGGFLGSIELARQWAHERPQAFLPSQFDNRANVRAHQATTGPEILSQLDAIGRTPTAFVAGVGTGGTVMGVGECLRARVPGVRVHPLEPANSPTLRTGHKVGKHRIQGISDEFVPSIVDLDALDSIVDVWDGDAIVMAQRLARELGLAVGISSGANFLGALQVALEQGSDSAVATVFADSNKKYLSTDLCREEPLRPEYVSGTVELLGCDVVACPKLEGVAVPGARHPGVATGC
ncbi:MAG: cysteine synthase family protein [bacterium]|nr:cysteine synthase family protein [bacterium]